MCGILFTNKADISKKHFLKSLGLMQHRGPDAPGGYYAQERVQLGHNRLQILDLNARSNQPFFSRDKRYAIIYNGEIYNYKELANKHHIKQGTTSDTELLLEIYIKLGSKMLNELNGMFAFVIYDTKTQAYFAARDRLGVKPLYFFQNNEEVIFASEIASILQFIPKAEIDPFSVRQYLKLRTFFNDRTVYKNISMFPAGCFMQSGKIQRYWTLPLEDKAPPSDEELKSLIESAVQYRLLSDVPVGSYLSGGLDSTIVAGLAKEPHTWTVGFKDHNEFEWAQIAAKKFKSAHHEVLIEKDEFVALAKELIKKRREPLSVPNEVLLYKMTKEVKKFNTVVLSGEGADELFFGYDRIFTWASKNKWDLKEFTKLYTYGSPEDYEVVEDALKPFMHYKKVIDRVAAFFQIAHLHGLLRRLDNSTMVCSVEARVPFVDYRLVERLAGVSFTYKMETGVIKAPLKRIFKELVPKTIIEREKIGFPVPLKDISFKIRESNPMDAWLKFNLKELGIKA
jgi:asparagine synthase (glutamine-hydrolysing)